MVTEGLGTERLARKAWDVVSHWVTGGGEEELPIGSQLIQRFPVKCVSPGLFSVVRDTITKCIRCPAYQMAVNFLSSPYSCPLLYPSMLVPTRIHP